MTAREVVRAALRTGALALLTTMAAAPIALPAAPPAAAARHKLTVTVYKGDFATVNSFIFSNGRSLVVMDVQRKAAEARKLVAMIKAMKLPLTHILISHGHTDHFTGMAVFREAFPDARIVVANEDIKADIKRYAIYMDTGGETGAEPPLDPALKPRTAEHPDGFDYERTIGVLASPRLEMAGGGTLELDTDHMRAEAPHITTVYSPDLNALFLSDFGYEGVHFWMGDDISREDLNNWRAELLKIKARYATLNPIVYPGHGDPSDMRIFDRSVRYIDDFLKVTAQAKTPDEAMAQMIALYPSYKQADFFLKYSVMEHVPVRASTVGHRAEAGWRATVRALAAAEFRNPAWGYSHSARDYVLARQMARADGVVLDDDVLFAAAYLHDMAAFPKWEAKDVDHADRAADTVDTILKGSGFPERKLDAVRAAIRTHMFDRDPKTPEALYLHDADALDWLGAVGVARVMALADPQGGQPDGPAMAKMLEANLANVPDRVLSPAGKALLPGRKAELEAFLRELKAETEGLAAL
ncbi:MULTISPECIES: HD domain-containing protein [unclassified Sphingomonas]|uniref:HD domain-containing protein n=1 Tax=unclassified Sphingomonas TaxID=196159 RepID=UPI0006F72450|nr:MULTISPECIES: HD domain-containing protein [unclassified Sphingomonas]KQX25604.1 metal-dependent phosphohydrolase [Sphingomonas sp. Root1294]KQY66594.1 metal-dependent phosphohydrolase [Sphingomonas sp. Root50]KRB90083.1 metal-dependent phosphohydrolase [Sphingomonas sp. Root720]